MQNIPTYFDRGIQRPPLTRQDFTRRKPSEALLAAKACIVDRHNWAQRSEARDEWGCRMSPEDHRAARFCSYGALFHTKGPLVDPDDDVIAYLSEAMFEGSSLLLLDEQLKDIEVFNDSYPHAEVIAAWDRAIQHAIADEQGAYKGHLIQEWLDANGKTRSWLAGKTNRPLSTVDTWIETGAIGLDSRLRISEIMCIHPNFFKPDASWTKAKENPMKANVIENQDQYRVTAEQAQKFRDTISRKKLEGRPSNMPPALWQAEIDGMQSVLDDLDASLSHWGAQRQTS